MSLGTPIYALATLNVISPSAGAVAHLDGFSRTDSVMWMQYGNVFFSYWLLHCPGLSCCQAVSERAQPSST